MVENTLPYTAALYEIAAENNAEKVYMDQLQQIAEIVEGENDFKLALNHPEIPREEKKTWIKNVFAGQIDPMILNFLLVLVDYGAASQLSEVYDDFAKLYKEANHIETVQVETAAALDAAQVEKLKNMLEKKLKTNVELVIKVNPALIAGLRINAKGLVVDNSMASKLNTLKETISQ